MNIDINYTAILVAGVAAMAAGAIWYVVFAKTIGKVRALTPQQAAQIQNDSKKMYAIGFLLNLLTAYALFHLMVMAEQFYGWNAIAAGLAGSFWAYIGIAMPVQASHILFGNYGNFNTKLKLFSINTGGQLVSMLVAGAVLGLMA